MNRAETKLLVEDWKKFINNDYSLQNNKKSLNEILSKEQKEATDTLVDFLGWFPGVGTVTSFAQATRSFLIGDYFNTVCYLISMFPLKGKLVGKSIQTIGKILRPYYDEYKETGVIDIDGILNEPEDDIINVILAIAEFKIRLKPFYRLAGGKNKVKQTASTGLEEFFDFLQAILDANKNKESESIKNEPITLRE